MKRLQKVRKAPVDVEVEIRLNKDKINLEFYSVGDLIGVVKDKTHPIDYELQNIDVYRVVKS